MDLSIIIVNYCSATDIVNAIRSAFQFPSAKTFEWIVVDNKSPDQSKDVILGEFPFVKWIEMGYNAGFARANNEGIRHSTGNIVLLLNPDTIVIDDAIGRCFQRFKISSCIACSVQLLYPDLNPQISGNYFMKGGLNHLLPLPYWGKFLKFIAQGFNTSKPHVLKAGEEEKVDWINGAFLMVKITAIDQVGLMDEDFFLYAEEAEWCSRLGNAGELCIFGEIQMIHIQGESVNRATSGSEKGYSNLHDKKGFQLMVSNHVRIRKQYGKSWFLFQLVNFTIAIPIFLVCSFFDRLLHGQHPFGKFKEVKGLTKNVLGLWKLLPVILRNEPHFYKVL